MSIANQMLAPIGNTQALFKSMPRYHQSDEAGWQQTLEGRIAEDQNNFKKAKDCFEDALKLAPEDKSKQLRLEWFNAVHPPTSVTASLETFEGKYTNPYNDEVEISIKDNNLIYKQFGQETKLVRISKTDFLPEKDQSFKISFDNDQMNIHFLHGDPKLLGKHKQPLFELNTYGPEFLMVYMLNPLL